MEAPGAERQGPRWRRFMPGAAVFAWPFIYFMPYVWPRNGSYRSVENDFLSLYYNYKVYLLDCLSQARFPWWSPSEAAGFPFYSNPFTQAFYPLNVPLALLYRLRGGYTALDHQRFTVLGVALFALGLYAWLRALGRSPRAALVAALILSVSFRMAETLRFPNAVHTAAWYPWILYAATRTLQEPSLRGKATFGLLCGLAGAFWLTGGYIYYLYYGLFLFGPYLVLLCVPKLGLAPAGHGPVRPVAALLVLGAFGLGAAALCGPYLLQSRALLQQTVDRQGGSWEYATASVFTSLDTLGSLVYPPAAQSEGWVYFGLAPLLLVVVYLLSAPAGLGPRLVLPAWLAAIAWITHGRESALFALLWHHLPFFSYLRVWARLSMIMLPILAWLLALAYQHFEELAGGHLGPGARRRALACLLGAYAVLGGAQWALHLRGIRDPYWGAFFGDLRLLEPLFVWSGAASFLVVALLLLGPSWRRATARGVAGGTVAGLLVLMAWLETGPAGTRLWSGVRPTPVPHRLNIGRENVTSFDARRVEHAITVTLGETFSVGFLANWHFERFVRFSEASRSRPGPRARLLGLTEPRKLFFSERVDHPSVPAFLADSSRFAGVQPQVHSYDGDVLEVDLDAPVLGYLSFIDNWDPDWSAAVDGKEVPIERLFGTFKAVSLDPGPHRVEFVYRPRLWPQVRTP